MNTSKTVYIIRHGVAQHNVRDPTTGERSVNLHDPKFTDPSLIQQGEMQASVLGEQLKRRGLVGSTAANGAVNNGEDMDVDGTNNDIASGLTSQQQQDQIDLIVCSPLTRCLQTASLIFPSYFNNAEQYSSSSSSDLLDRRCKVCCHGEVREAFGMHYPDKRSPLSQLKSKFPTVTYHPSLTEHDNDWQPNTRETTQDVSRRIQAFFHWLLQQPHNNIAIVTHGVWAECALVNYCPEVLQHGEKRVYNCDVYQGKLVGSLGDKNGSDFSLTDVTQMSFYPV